MEVAPSGRWGHLPRNAYKWLWMIGVKQRQAAGCGAAVRRVERAGQREAADRQRYLHGSKTLSSSFPGASSVLRVSTTFASVPHRRCNRSGMTGFGKDPYHRILDRSAEVTPILKCVQHPLRDLVTTRIVKTSPGERSLTSAS